MSLIKISLLLFALHSSFAAAAGERDKIMLKECSNLDSLSKACFELGDAYFIIVDAYEQGIIKDGGKYEFEFRDNVLKLNGDLVPPTFREQVVEKLKVIDERNGSTTVHIQVGYTDSYTEGVHIYPPKEIKSPVVHTIISAERTTARAELVHMLQQDGFIDTPQDVDISYSSTTIKVNGIYLRDAFVEKYLKVLALASGVPAPQGQESYAGFSFTITEDMLLKKD